jgi:hypothetical protein
MAYNSRVLIGSPSPEAIPKKKRKGTMLVTLLNQKKNNDPLPPQLTLIIPEF